MHQSFKFSTLRWRIAQALEIRWWQHYLRRRDRVAYLNRKRQYWQRVLTAANIQPIAGQRILDAGCGPAGIFIALEQCQVDALDPLLQQYAANLPHFQPLSYPYVRFLYQPLETFEPATPYPLVFCLNAINHVADLPLALDRLVAALAPGGKLVLAVDVHRSSFLKRLFRQFPVDILHPHQHDETDYHQLLTERHLNIQQTVSLREGTIFRYLLMVAVFK